MTNKTLYKIDNLSFSLSGKLILKALSFDIIKSDYLAVIGPNGAGKTTLLKCLMGIHRCESGRIFFDDIDLTEMKQKELARSVAYVPQNDGRPLPFTVKEFVMLARYPHLSPFTSYTQQDKAVVKEALQTVNIARLENRRLNTLSGGERQMVLIAAALAQESEIILFDEPTAFLDPKYESAIYSIMDKIHRAGKTVVMVTHDINGAILHSTKVLILKEGRIVFKGEPQRITGGRILSDVYEKPFSFMDHPQNGKRIVVPGAAV